jgi:hypothetical protein
MVLGLGIVLIVIGAVFLAVIEVDVAGIDQNALGWILIGAGVLALVVGTIQMQQARRRHTVVEERRDVV